MKTRHSVVIPPADERKIRRELDRWAETEDFVGLRTRAYIYLLWDGAVRPKIARGLNAEEVVKDPRARNIVMKEKVTMRACPENRNRGREFYVSEDARAALRAYLKVARRDGWIPGQALVGPLFVSSHYFGTGPRMGSRTPLGTWQRFLLDHLGWENSYQLDDVVFSGRSAYLEAAGGDVQALLDHGDLSTKSGMMYAEKYKAAHEATRKALSPADVLRKVRKR